MSHASTDSEPDSTGTPALPRVARIIIYATATPIGAAAAVVGAASVVVGPTVSLVAAAIAAACTAAIGTTALANTNR